MFARKHKMYLFYPELEFSLIEEWYSASRDQLDKAEIKRRNERETILLESLNTCPISSGLYLNPDKVEDFLKNEYNDYDKFKDLKCALKSLFMPSIGHTEIQEKIKTWLRNPEPIDLNTGGGVAMNVDFHEVNDLMILKSSKKHDLIHEQFVGTILNNLRRKIPNFVLMLGGFQCSPPFFQNKKVDFWCTLDHPEVNIRYILYENISPSENFIDILSSVSFNDLFSYLLQIAFSLKEAEVYNFSHNDLHLGNVMLRKNTTKKRWVMYSYWENNVYMNIEKIATIIDFGEANISINNEMFGPIGNEKIGVYKDKPNPVRDFYRFIASVTIEAKRKGNRLVYLKLLKFFDNFFRDFLGFEDLKFYEKIWFSLPPPDYFQIHPKMDNLIDLLQKIYPKPFSRFVKTKQPFDYTVDDNKTNDGYFNHIGPKTLYTLYDTKNPCLFTKAEVKDLIIKACKERKLIKQELLDIKFRRVLLGKRTLKSFEVSQRKIDRYLRQVIKLYDLAQDHHRLDTVMSYAESLFKTGAYQPSLFDYQKNVWSEIEFAKELVDDIYVIFESQSDTYVSTKTNRSFQEIFLLARMIDVV